jgi:acetyl esterase/lipase
LTTDPAPARTPTVLRDLVYAEPVGFRPLSLDLHLPARRDAALIVFLHGGGWRLGSRRIFCPSMTAADAPFGRIAAAGFALASVDYRLSGEAVFPAQTDDALAAVRWLRAHADEFGFDADRLVLWGESAGATIAALVALQPDTAARGLIDWYGPTDLTEMARTLGSLDDPDCREAGWLGHPVAAGPERARAASPASHVYGGAPPTLIAHGLDDAAVPHAQSELFAAALTRVRVPTELELVPGAGHMWQGDVDRIGLLERALAFARRVTG